MKTILLSITILVSFAALNGCTNDEGEQDVDFLNPEEEETTIIND